MKRSLILIPLVLLAACAPSAQPPATIGGRIAFSGPKPSPKLVDMDADPECKKDAKQEEALIVGGNGELADVFVYIKSGMENKTFAPPPAPVIIDQKGCWFQPRVLGIQTGQVLQVTNSDPVTHNIHPQPTVNREWNASQAPADPPVTRRFSQQEILFPVKCNIHNWMRAFIGVVAHPYFAVTKADGSFELPNVPPGAYTLAAVHSTLGAQERTVTLQSAKKQEVSFTFKGN